MVMSDVSLTVPYEAYLIAETSSAAVETSAVPLAAILSSANTLVDTRQRTIQRVSMILSIRFLFSVTSVFVYIGSVKSNDCNIIDSTVQLCAGGQLDKFILQHNITAGIVDAVECKRHPHS